MRKIAIACAVVALFSGACGSSEDTGSKELLKGVGNEGGDGRLGEIERETPAPTAAPTATPKAATPTPKPATPAPTPVPQAFAVDITPEGYKPFNFRVFVGTTIKVTNKDNVAHTMTSDEGPGAVFDTGQIQPGGTASVVAGKAGNFNFHDENRPNFVGAMEVVAR